MEKGYEGKAVIFGIRPEDIHSEQVALEASPEAVVNSEVVVSELLGAETMLYTKTQVLLNLFLKSMRVISINQVKWWI